MSSSSITQSPKVLSIRSNHQAAGESIDMYQDLIKQIAEEMKRFGLTQQPACSPNDIEILKMNSFHELGHTIPDGYIAFLSVVNGLDWNGLVVYASKRSQIVGFSDRFIEGFVAGNLAYQDFEPMKDYLIFADDGDALFTYQISTSKFQVVTSVGLTLLESFNTFDELLYDALQCHL